MDIFCVKCGEPLDTDELHDIEGKSFDEALAAYKSKGCRGIDRTCSDEPNDEAAMYSSALYEILGDDIDGVAAMMQDYGF